MLLYILTFEFQLALLNFDHTEFMFSPPVSGV